MGGEIEVASQVGEGSVFTFSIVCRRGKDESGGQRKPSDALRDMGILLVDDNETNLRILERQVSRWGMRTVSALDAAGAMDALQSAANEDLTIGVAVVDMCMPGVDGIGVARRIRSSPRLASMPLVLLSSATLIGDQQHFAETTFDACLLKPVSERILYQCLLRVCKKRRVASVPQDVADAKPLTEAQRQVDGAERGLAKILLVEDTAMHAMLARRVLERAGHHVTACETGAEALRILRRTEFDVVLMDCQMPIMNGYQATRRIRADEAASGRHQVVIAFTASATSEDCKRCYDEGMDDYLAKPYKARDLLRIGEEWLPWAVANSARVDAGTQDT